MKNCMWKSNTIFDCMQMHALASDLKFCQAVSKHTQGIFLSCQELSNRLNTVQSKVKNYKLFWSFLNICNVSFKNGKGRNVILNQKREFMKYFSLIRLISQSFGHTHRHTIQPFPLKTFCVFFSSHNPPHHSITLFKEILLM